MCDSHRRARPRLPPVRRSLGADGCHPRRSRVGRHRHGPVLPASAASPACDALPRLHGGRPPGDRASRSGELLRTDVGRHWPGAAGARRRDGARRRERRGLMRLLNRHRLWHVAVDAGIIALAWWLAWHLRFDQTRPGYYNRYLATSIVLLVVAIQLPVFVLSGFSNRWWRYVSTRDMWGALRGVGLGTLAVYLVFTIFSIHRVSVPRGVWFIDLLLCLAFVAGVRMLARTLIERPLPGRIVARGRGALVVGAGDAAQLIVKEMLRTPTLGYTPIGFVDDDPRKKNIRLHGIRVLGTIDDLPRLMHDRRPDEVLIAIPSASGELRERIVEIARRERIAVKT